MSDKLSLKDIEKKSFTSYLQDGLIELLLSYILMISVLSSILMDMGVSDSIRIPIYLPLMILIPAPALYLCKIYITVTRLCNVKFGAKRKRDSKQFLIFAIFINTFLIIALLATVTNKLDRITAFLGHLGFPLVIFCFVFSIFAFLVYLFDIPRFYIIGTLMGISQTIHTGLREYTTFKYDGMIAYGVPALILLIMGIVLLNRFMKKYPNPAKEN